ncbi:MAG: amino acid racemase [Erysipelotrichaceae bacterium]|nr:amino acid racemase [Erysipelotrichaceae bacterium]
MDKKTIGILGGMGPRATCELYSMIISNTKASLDQEHIHVLIDSNCQIPDRTRAIISDGESPVEMLQASAKVLENAGADFLIIPCNTSHHFYDEIAKAVHIPILHMIKETVSEIRNEEKVIVLCTEGTRDSGVYGKVLQANDIGCIYPDPILQNEVNDIIYNAVKKGLGSYDASFFNQELAKLDHGHEIAAILGCTEMSYAAQQYHLEGRFIDPMLILAKKAIRYAGYQCIDD